LFDVVQKNAEKCIYTTFIGIGVDFNTNLVSLISTIRASNYFSVNSSKEFKKQMDEEFDYMVTVNVLDASIDVESNSWEAERVFGSPGYEIPKKGRLLFMDSMFPSLKDNDTMTKGGVVLVKLKKLSTLSSTLTLHTSYADVDGNKFNETDSIQFPDTQNSEDFYQNASIRKAILLTRYVSFMKHFLRDSKSSKGNEVPSIDLKTGITIPSLEKPTEYNSRAYMVPLKGVYKDLFERFIAYYEREVDAIGDKTLEKELKQLLQIIEVGK